MSNEGWIKLFRSIQECDIWTLDAPFCPRSAFIDLLILANHKNGNAFNKKRVNRGQHWTSLNKLSARWHWRKPKVKEFLTMLQLERMITVDYEKQGLMITVTNYNKFQAVVTVGTTNVSTNVSTSVTEKGTATGTQTIRDI